MLEWLEAALWSYVLMVEITVVNQLGKKLIMWTHIEIHFTLANIYTYVRTHTHIIVTDLCVSLHSHQK